MDPRKATISLQYNGANASGQIGTYLSAFQYKDVASGTSDSIGLDLNDRDRKWIGAWFPPKGGPAPAHDPDPELDRGRAAAKLPLRHLPGG